MNEARAIRLHNAVSIALLCTFLCSCGFLPISRMSRSGAQGLEKAPKPLPVDSAFDGCGPDGSQPDYQLNRRKNRIDEGTYFLVPWKTIARLPWPRQVGYRFRNQWGSGETREVARYEGTAIQVEGYLVGYRLEVPEPPNCYAKDPQHKDYHMWLSENPRDKRGRSVVVEITPRVRAMHPAWTEDRLAALQESQPRLRVSGWLMLDQMHSEKVGGNRATLWEVHPIMRLEWQRRDSSWVSLDSLSPASDSALGAAAHTNRAGNLKH
jgi:hypothetical protein